MRVLGHALIFKIARAAAIMVVAFFATLRLFGQISSAPAVPPAVWDDKLELALNPEVARAPKRGENKTGQEPWGDFPPAQ